MDSLFLEAVPCVKPTSRAIPPQRNAGRPSRCSHSSCNAWVAQAPAPRQRGLSNRHKGAPSEAAPCNKKCPLRVERARALPTELAFAVTDPLPRTTTLQIAFGARRRLLRVWIIKLDSRDRLRTQAVRALVPGHGVCRGPHSLPAGFRARSAVGREHRRCAVLGARGARGGGRHCFRLNRRALADPLVRCEPSEMKAGLLSMFLLAGCVTEFDVARHRAVTDLSCPATQI